MLLHYAKKVFILIWWLLVSYQRAVYYFQQCATFCAQLAAHLASDTNSSKLLRGFYWNFAGTEGHPKRKTWLDFQKNGSSWKIAVGKKLFPLARLFPEKLMLKFYRHNESIRGRYGENFRNIPQAKKLLERKKKPLFVDILCWLMTPILVI